MTITIHDVTQGTEAWLRLRRGILTASTIGQLITPATLKVAANDKSRALIRQLVAERVTDFLEDSYVSGDMQRGLDDEAHARADYVAHTGRTVELVGFVTRTVGGVTIGYSPDGFVGSVGAIEIKSRLARHQVDVILSREVPAEHRIQVQCGLLVSNRSWCDYVSYCGGMPLPRIRVEANEATQSVILEAAERTEEAICACVAEYHASVRANGWRVSERRATKLEIEDDEDE